jgi:DNA-binding NtrC family response regulator
MPLLPSLSGVEVLVVEDEAETREVLSEFCRSLGLNVTAAVDGISAVKALQRAPAQFQMVLTDIWLNGADGFEVLKTGYATLDSALRAVRDGAYDYLPKPFALGQLEVVFGRIGDRIALEKEARTLSRQMDGLRHAPSLRRDDLAGRLDAIDARLGRIEEMVRRQQPRTH